MGSLVMFSTPQAMTTSAIPAATMPVASVAASWEDPHCESIVMQGVSSAPPWASQAVRVTFIP